MSRFHSLYKADLRRYGGKPDLYIRLFLYFYRRAVTSSFSPAKLVWKMLFAFIKRRRGLEFTAVDQIGGACI